MEGGPVHGQVEEHAAQGPYVYLVVVGGVEYLFGSQVEGGAYPGLLTLAPLEYLAHPHVAQFDLAPLTNQNVRRLYVPMHDPLLVQELQGTQQSLHQSHEFLLTHVLATALEFLDELGQVPPVDVLHDDGDGVVFQEGVEVLDDVGVVQQLHDLDLLEGLGAFPALHLGEVYAFYDEGLPGESAPDLVDHPVGPLAQLAQYLEVLHLVAVVLVSCGVVQETESLGQLLVHLLVHVIFN